MHGANGCSSLDPPRGDWLALASTSLGEGVETAQVVPDSDQHSQAELILKAPVWKRCVDLVGAALGLVALSPMFVLVPIALLLTSPGPVFFRQRRLGRQGRPFQVLKFRTLRPATDPQAHQAHVRALARSDATLNKLKQADREFPLGNLLRKACIDEIPQLVNVLFGEMSLVGPRPDVLELVEYQPWQRARFVVRPGITGLWQVSGKNKTTFNEMMQLDQDYVRRLSPALDLKILLSTIPAIVRGFKQRS